MNRVGTLNVSLLYSRRAEAPSDTVPRSVQRTSYLAGEKALLILLKLSSNPSICVYLQREDCFGLHARLPLPVGRGNRCRRSGFISLGSRSRRAGFNTVATLFRCRRGGTWLTLAKSRSVLLAYRASRSGSNAGSSRLGLTSLHGRLVFTDGSSSSSSILGAANWSGSSASSSDIVLLRRSGANARFELVSDRLSLGRSGSRGVRSCWRTGC